MNKFAITAFATGAAVAITLGVAEMVWAADAQPSETPIPGTRQCITASFAQGPPPFPPGFSGAPGSRRHPEPDGELRDGRYGSGPDVPGMTPALNLTDEQIQKVKVVFDENRPKMEAIRREQAAKIDTVISETQKQIRPILTTAQQAVFDDLQKLQQDSEALRKNAGQ